MPASKRTESKSVFLYTRLKKKEGGLGKAFLSLQQWPSRRTVLAERAQRRILLLLELPELTAEEAIGRERVQAISPRQSLETKFKNPSPFH